VSEPVLVLVGAVVACVPIDALVSRRTRRSSVAVTTLRRELDLLSHDPRASASLRDRGRARRPERRERGHPQAVVRRLKRERRR
jgi:hypothetical protein